MAGGNGRRLRAVAVAATAALVSAAPAYGQDEGGLFAPLHFEEAIEYTRSQAGQTASVLYVNELQAGSNRQGVTGYLDGAPFTGVAIDHDYTSQGDHGTYSLSGWADPAGAAPALPFGGSLTLSADRSANVATWTLNGSLGSQSVSYTSAPLMLPTGIYQLGGVIPLF